MTNLRNFILDVNCSYTASNAIIYKSDVSNTVLQFRLTKNSYYYTILDSTKISVSIGGVLVDQSKITLIDRYKGLFRVELSDSNFTLGDNRQYEVVIDLSSQSNQVNPVYTTYLSLSTSIMYSTGTDNLEQTELTYILPNTTTQIPTMPNPDFVWNNSETTLQ